MREWLGLVLAAVCAIGLAEPADARAPQPAKSKAPVVAAPASAGKPAATKPKAALAASTKSAAPAGKVASARSVAGSSKAAPAKVEVAKGKTVPAKVQVAKGRAAPAKVQVAKGKAAPARVQVARGTPSHGKSHFVHSGRRHFAAHSAAPRHASNEVRARPVYARSSGGGYSRGAWGRGLAPAYGVQTTSCPDGTMATTAHGHSSVVRCIPI